MDQINYIQIVLCLKEYLRREVGNSYPIEIITLIILMLYKPIKISCGWNHTCALINEEVYVWGKNSNSQLGLGDYRDRILPRKLPLDNVKSIKCGMNHTIVLTYEGDVYVWGQLNLRWKSIIHYEINVPAKLDFMCKVKKIICDKYKNIVVTSDNVTYGWGDCKYNRYIDVFDEHMTDTPKKIIPSNLKYGENHIILLNPDEKLYGRGLNETYQLGLGADSEFFYTDFQELTLKDVHMFDCGCNHTVASTKSGHLYSLGENNEPTPREIILPGELDITSIKCGADHTIIQTRSKHSKSDRQFYGWGKNHYGQLSLDHNIIPSPQKLPLSNVLKVKCGAYHSMAVTLDNKIYVWGCNEEGQLGLADRISRSKPTELEL